MLYLNLNLSSKHVIYKYVYTVIFQLKLEENVPNMSYKLTKCLPLLTHTPTQQVTGDAH